MKKFFPILIFILLITSLGIYLNSKGSIPKTNQSIDNRQNQTKKETNNKTNNFLEEALKNKISVKCVYQDAEKNQVISYFKGDKVYIQINQTKPGFNNFLYIDKKAYMWENKTKTGMMLLIDESNQSTDNIADTFKDKNKIAMEIQKYQYECKKENLNDSFFQPPKDIVFQDLTQLQQGFSDINIKDNQ